MFLLKFCNMFRHKCEVFIQYVSRVRLEIAILFFYKIVSIEDIFSSLWYNFWFLSSQSFASAPSTVNNLPLPAPHICQHILLLPISYFYTFLVGEHHGVANLSYESRKKKSLAFRTSIPAYSVTNIFVTHLLFLTIPVKGYYAFIRFL